MPTIPLSNPPAVAPAIPPIRPAARSPGSIRGKASSTISWISSVTTMTAAVTPSVASGLALM
jgi:hypothetical protein